ncbi:efflux RND transporter permease subunit [Sphingomonas prati]|uniref:Multidrug efflux pump subunit AcrB n=1 Tax=Sphingomonas prati TaxID=1843237 RepID=A0A7W9F372_9SPHN|nr:efflux RND transporter permease subunit [Sphingomonas prati]MBB5729200.1 multidrug efflux pump subunit AcrB [Sphingomonas prati]GGE84327.1 acriflavine resistance protein B [Sphingomonas prati]
MRNISAWSIRNPIPALVLFAALTLAGIISFMRMDVNQQPDIAFPGANIIVSQPGAAPSEMETQVTQRIEAAVRGINGIDEIQSTVTEGSSQTFVQFVLGTPIDRAVTDVREAVQRVRSDLPEGIQEPQVTRIDIDGDAIVSYSVAATDMTLEQLSWFVDNQVTKRLLAVSGVASVEREGGVTREIRVILDPARMQAQGVTANQINAQLRSTNLNAAGGRAEIAGAEQSVRILGNAADAYALGQKQISVGNGRAVKLADIARVEDGYAEQRRLARMNGREVVSFDLYKAKGFSDVTVYHETQKAIETLRKENPGVRFQQLYTSVDYTEAQYESAIEAMILGAVLAVIVVFLFLRDWRATVISALAIPLSAIPTFWAMDLIGFTLNSMTLLALSLVAGVLVDDAIVEIENIVRHIRMGKSVWQASIDAADEIGLAVVATTFSIVAVFFPVSVMPGIAGQFFKNFGFTVVVAVLMSLAVARLITPMIAAYFLRPHGERDHGGGRVMLMYQSVLRWTLDRSSADAARARGGIGRRFAWLRDHRWWTMGFGLLAFIATIISFATLPQTFFPVGDTDYSQLRIQLVPGSTLQQTEAVADRAARLLDAQPEVQSAYTTVQVGTARVLITLRKDRKRTSTEFERELQPQMNRIADARINFQAQNGGGGRDIAIVLASDDPVKLDAAAQTVVDQMARLPKIRAPRTEGDLPRPEIVIRPRIDLAADMGVTTQALSTAIRIATLGDIDQNVAKFSLSDRQIPIRVAIDEGSRRNLSTIRNLPVPTTAGGSVPLSVVADIGFGEGPSQVRRLNQVRRLLIGADLAPGAIDGEERAKILALPAMKNLPAGVEYVTSGQSKSQEEMISNFITAVFAGVLLVLAVLILLYKRVVPPFVNLGSFLLAPLGGLIALHIAGMPVSLPVYIGLLMLLGIVAKNSILLIDFTIEEMDRGVPKYEAILEAGHKRAQPIVMTTVAMVAGMIPIALSIGGDGSFNQPMAVVVIGGLIASTLLTLLIVPAGFSLADGFERRVGPFLRRTLTNGGEAKGGGSGVTQPAE